VGDLHVTVVDNIGKVIGREAVALHDDIVILGVFLLEAVINYVSNHEGLLGALEPNGELLALMGTMVRLLERDVSTRAGVKGWLT
jgi:hypothetical protein